MAIRQPHDRRINLLMHLTMDERSLVSQASLVSDPGGEHLFSISFDPPSCLFTAVDTFCWHVHKTLPRQDGVRHVIRITRR